MIFQLYELLEEISISEKRKEFKILCHEKKIKSKSTQMKRIGNIYALNIIMKNLRDFFWKQTMLQKYQLYSYQETWK